MASLIDGFKNAGNYEVIFNAENLSSGVYFVRLNAADLSAVRKMNLIK